MTWQSVDGLHVKADWCMVMESVNITDMVCSQGKEEEAIVTGMRRKNFAAQNHQQWVNFTQFETFCSLRKKSDVCTECKWSSCEGLFKDGNGICEKSINGHFTGTRSKRDCKWHSARVECCDKAPMSNANHWINSHTLTKKKFRCGMCMGFWLFLR